MAALARLAAFFGPYKELFMVISKMTEAVISKTEIGVTADNGIQGFFAVSELRASVYG